MNRRGFIFSWVVLLVVLFMGACGSRQQVQRRRQAGVPSTEVLSRRFGLRVTERDNLRLYAKASQWLGVPYRYGGQTKRGVDCSALVSILYREVYRKNLSLTAATQLKDNCRKIGRDKLREGDLVFFHTTGRKRKATHVGIYLKNGHFIHASTSRGVIVSSLSEPYYLRTWLCAGRVK
ncbi:MAG: C40 family peptidase [Tannerella sp.]|nr:C40 family peptidase [Tannerella sp.]